MRLRKLRPFLQQERCQSARREHACGATFKNRGWPSESPPRYTESNMRKIRLYGSESPQGRRKGRVRRRNPEPTAEEYLRCVVPTVGALIPVRLRVERLPEGAYLATSDEIPGLVAQGRTVAETLEIAEDVARRLTEARWERSAAKPSQCTILVKM